MVCSGPSMKRDMVMRLIKPSCYLWSFCSSRAILNAVALKNSLGSYFATGQHIVLQVEVAAGGRRTQTHYFVGLERAREEVLLQMSALPPNLGLVGGGEVLVAMMSNDQTPWHLVLSWGPNFQTVLLLAL